MIDDVIHRRMGSPSSKRGSLGSPATLGIPPKKGATRQPRGVAVAVAVAIIAIAIAKGVVVLALVLELVQGLVLVLAVAIAVS